MELRNGDLGKFHLGKLVETRNIKVGKGNVGEREFAHDQTIPRSANYC